MSYNKLTQMLDISIWRCIYSNFNFVGNINVCYVVSIFMKSVLQMSYAVRHSKKEDKCNEKM
jgi:hypothetical protein